MINTFQIDINADVGEGIGNEPAIMPYLSSCNIACGGHTGDVRSMTEVVKLASKYQVKIGAHPSFPDQVNFGRVEMILSETELYNSLKQQIQALQAVLDSENAELHHIKPHGALYNMAVKDEKIAKVIIEVVKSIALSIKLYAPFGSVLDELAHKAQIEVVLEGFADRNYNDDLSLVSRSRQNALIQNKEQVLPHVLSIVKAKKVKTVCGVEVPLHASTLCVHGDTENALDILKYLNLELPKNGVEIY